MRSDVVDLMQAKEQCSSPPVNPSRNHARMSKTFHAFVSMSPPWNLSWRVHTRMAVNPASSEPGSSLHHLRNVQAAILSRRLHLDKTNPPPPPDPEPTGDDLADALFPGSRPVDFANDPAESVSSGQGHPTTVSAADEEPMLKSSSAGVLQNRQRAEKHVANSSTHALHGEQASSLKPRAAPSGSSRGRVSRSASSVVRSVGVPDSHCAFGSGASKRFMTNGVASREFQVPPAESGETSTHGAEILGNRKRATSLEDWKDGKDGVVITRAIGSLPWKSEEKILKASKDVAVGEVFDMSALSIFLSDPDLQRADGRLPRKGSSFEPVVGAVDGDCVSPESHAIVDGLNDLQREAVLADRETACLVLAGPGSGKTRVLTHRIAYLVKKYNVSPYRIMAVTFTNKAAEEMRERVSNLLKLKSAPDWAAESTSRLAVGTFHSICVRILRKYGSEIDIPSNFVICDASDAKQVITRLMKKHEGVGAESGKVWEISSQISKIKNDRNNELSKRWPKQVYSRAAQYRALYDGELRAMNQLDFDDLLLETRHLLQRSERVLEELTDRYEHVLVDEWQDTNHVQFDIVALLASKRQNLFVVGDADQSIYKFRGADSGNLHRFSEAFPNSSRVALEHNYRSSACIVAAAQAVIEGDESRPEKKMTTTNEFGNKVILREADDDRQEAHFVVKTLREMVRSGKLRSFSDVAIMYRTNAQSRLLEEGCIQTGTPYRLLSGTKFYDRQEIRDLVSYLRILSNPADDSAFRRIVNTPPRGIGKKTVDVIEEYSSSRKVSLSEGVSILLSAYAADEKVADEVDLRKAALRKLAEFHSMISTLRKLAVSFATEPELSDGDSDKTKNVDTLLDAIIKAIGYQDYLTKRDGADGQNVEKVVERLANVDELVRAASRHSSLPRYMDSVSLMVESKKEAQAQEEDDAGKNDAVSLMTLHGGKGLEFGAAFITGAEDSVIPLRRFGNTDLEEERRLLYVGMTRAKQYLYITWRSKKLMVQGGKAYKRDSDGASKFLDDIPPRLVHRTELTRPTSKYQQGPGPQRSSTWKTSSKVRRSAGDVTSKTQHEWRVGDSVRCKAHGRGMVTESHHPSPVVQVMFVDGSKHLINTSTDDIQLLFSPF